MYSLELSDILRMQVQPLTKFRQFGDMKDFTDRGLHRGDTFHWNVYSNVANAGTTLVETSTIAETNFTIIQGTGTVQELANSIPYTGKLDNLSKHPVAEIIQKVLGFDCAQVLDGQAWKQFDSTQLMVVASGGTSTNAVTLTTNGTATLTNTVAFHKDHVKAIVDTMKERNIPPYMGNEYMAIAWPTTYRTMKNDMESVYQYRDQGFQAIINGEIGKFEGVRFIEQTNIPKGNYSSGNYLNSSSFTTWSQADSDWIYFFGSDTVGEAIVVPEEMRGKIPTDYGRSKGISWYYLGGFAIAHTDAKNSRIVKWASAA